MPFTSCWTRALIGAKLGLAASMLILGLVLGLIELVGRPPGPRTMPQASES